MADLQPELQPELGQADTARDDAVIAYDALVQELAKAAPSADQVVKHAGAMWTNSMKFYANLALLPGKAASAIAT